METVSLRTILFMNVVLYILPVGVSMYVCFAIIAAEVPSRQMRLAPVTLLTWLASWTVRLGNILDVSLRQRALACDAQQGIGVG